MALYNNMTDKIAGAEDYEEIADLNQEVTITEKMSV
jgi:hypothetical protein